MEFGLDKRPQTLQGLAFPLQEEAKGALRQLKQKRINYIQLVSRALIHNNYIQLVSRALIHNNYIQLVSCALIHNNYTQMVSCAVFYLFSP
jgi:hypothetical protein